MKANRAGPEEPAQDCREKLYLGGLPPPLECDGAEAPEFDPDDELLLEFDEELEEEEFDDEEPDDELDPEEDEPECEDVEEPDDEPDPPLPEPEDDDDPEL